MKLIYVVEDHDVIRNGVVQYLGLSGFSAEGCGNLESAREAFKKQVPDKYFHLLVVYRYP